MEENYNELGAILWVSPTNNMYGKFNVIAVGDSELDGTYITRAFDTSDLRATMRVRVQRNRDLNSSMDVMYRGNSDMVVSLHPTNSDFLEASLDVRPFNTMYGLFDVIEPPRITETKNPSQDATVRSLEEYRYMNFGKSATMMAGQSADERLYSYIKFDLSTYTDSINFEKSKLRIHYPSTIGEDFLELWTIDREWQEYGITYANKPLSSELVSKTYTINKADRYVEFELLEYIQSIVNGGKENFGLEIRGASGKTYSMFTRETSKAPELISTYFDSRVWNIARTELTATLSTYGTGKHELSASFEVHTDAGYDSLISTLYVHRYDTPVHVEVNAMLTVSNPELRTGITIVQIGNHDFDVSLGVRRNREEDRLSFLSVNNPSIDATMFVKYKEYLDTSMTVRVPDDNKLTSMFAVSKPELNATMYARYSSDLHAYLTINVNKEEFLTSTLTISKPELAMTLNSRAFNTSELNAIFGVIGREEEFLESILTVNNPELRTTLVARQFGDSELSATLSARVTRDDAIESLLAVSNPELRGIVYVPYYNDLSVNLTVQRYDNSDLHSMLSVSIPEISATLQPRIFEDKEFYLSASNPELNSIVIIRAYAEDDVDAFLYPKVLGANDLIATLGSVNKLRSGAYYYII